MPIEEFFSLFFTLGLAVMGLSGWMVYRVWQEMRRHRIVSMHFEERLAAYRNAVRAASLERED